MADFTRYSNFDSKSGFVSVRASADMPILEVDLNETQQILDFARADLVRRMTHSGVIDYNPTNALGGAINDAQLSTSNSLATNTFALGKFRSLLNGYMLNVSNSAFTDGHHMIQLDAPPSTNVTPAMQGSARDDLVFLEVWFQEVGGIGNSTSSDTNVYTYGGVNNSTETNNILDSSLNVEATHRIQLRWRIRVVDGVDFASYPEGLNATNVYAQGSNSATTTVTFSKATTFTGVPFSYDAGMYVASGSSLNTFDGYVYAIPLFRVRRRNSGAFNPDTNPLGGATYANGVVSDRPDGLYCNIIDANDIIDLRHQVSFTGLNLDMLLRKNLDQLLQTKLTTMYLPRYCKDYVGLNTANYQDDVNSLLFLNFDFNSTTGTANSVAVNGAMNSGTASFVNGVNGSAIAPSTTQYVTYTMPTALPVGATTFSVEFMFKPQWNWNDNTYHSILKFTDGTNDSVAIYKYANGTLQVSLPNASNPSWYLPPALSALILAGTWHKLTAVLNNLTMSVSIDGVPLSTSSTDTTKTTNVYATALQTASSKLYLGYYNGYYANCAFDLVRVSNIARSEQLLPSGFNAYSDHILDGPDSDFPMMSDDLGGISGANGRTNPYGLSRVPNQIAARVSYNASEIRHYYGQGFTPNWSSSTKGTNPTGSFDSSAEAIKVTANEAAGGTTYTFTAPSNIPASNLFISVFGDVSATPTSLTYNPSNGLVTATFGSNQATVPTFWYTTAARHAHFVPSTKGFVVHDWVDDNMSTNGTVTTFQTTKYNVNTIQQVRSYATGNTTSTIQNGGYTTQGLNASTYVVSGGASGTNTLTVNSASNFFSGQNIRISNGQGGWNTATISSISGNTITVSANFATTIPANAVVQGTAQVTFATAPVSGAVDIVYESVKMLEYNDYLRVMYQHVPYQGVGIPNALNLLYDSKEVVALTYGTGKNATTALSGSGSQYVAASAQLPAAAPDYNLKMDNLQSSSMSGNVDPNMLRSLTQQGRFSTATVAQAIASNLQMTK